MTTSFSDALKESGLAEKFNGSKYKQWSAIEDKQETFDLIVQASAIEKCSPVALAYTLLNETVFVLRPKPNTNGHDLNFWFWDCGPAALNFGWSFRSAWILEYKLHDLHFSQVFGEQFYEADGKTPCVFSGDPLSNIRACCRKLMSKKITEVERTGKAWEDDDEKRVTLYPGPKAREYRRKAWQEWRPVFTEFFKNYSGS